jgi:hypothetical protein
MFSGMPATPTPAIAEQEAKDRAQPISESVEQGLFQKRGNSFSFMAEPGDGNKGDALLTVTHDIGQLVGVRTPFIDSVLGLARLRANGLGLLDNAA